MKQSNNLVAVIFTYSFDSETPVYLFESEDEAKNFLKNSYNEELRIDREENEWVTDGVIDLDAGYAEIVNHFEDHEDRTEFRIGSVYR